MITSIVATLSLFVAVIAGSSLRPQLAAAQLPEPAAWTDVTVAQPISHTDHKKPMNNKPTNKKPFHSSWMTRDVLTKWTALSPHSGWLALPASFGPAEFQPGGVHLAAAMPAVGIRDPLIQLCVVRR